MDKREFIAQVLEAIRNGEHEVFWYFDNTDKAVEYILKQIEDDWE